ncbi:hypothetical protein [Helicobacter pylori]|uniref:hypothetical protein n=1 Tax=Helicobacter pylori TaxID=210 RepID=UPI00196B86F8|nr:hypothetical protein [Helicobacter pylori]
MKLLIIPNLYLKNLYFKSLRRFGRFVLWVYPTYQYLTNISTLKTLIFDKKLNLLEK